MSSAGRFGGPPRPGISAAEVVRGFRWGNRSLVPASAQAHRPPMPAREFPTAWARSTPARVARTAFLEGAMNPLLHAALTPTVAGAEVFDEVGDGPVIVVSNHSSHLDAPLLLCALPRKVRERTAVTAAADYFFESTWRGLSTAFAFGTVPIERRGGVPSTLPLDLLRDGWNLVVFPEGTRSQDGARGRFRLGAGYLAVTAGVPVVPAALRGAYAAMPRGRAWPLPGRPRVSVRFGSPIRAGDGEDVRVFTARLSAEVDRLGVEDSTSWWASLRASGAGEGPSTSSVPGSVAVPPARAGRGEAPVARWRRVWEATEPPAPVRSRSPWER
ncbi:1-acyl-sn-glycerol-3-phosphate acyltransferases [Parafrankia irregularis]|uniref:1-acyl-sn-glycerol-3-phosphate acyltransferases n=1 Tax=Parafrankia irregularis TaxID=795642 RepID=A0A0S4QMZ0_9ACTN|nr:MULTISPECIES: lysophospholipid acyltransferase family protein [Parafrankia]MBE3201179.1 1-acyl-sn-glycerol-3-phosphate acyltransferase [Parafrankia sp. CH37]CUU56386.1 1-acyl-sn-glycerol-3-phosphate acyltransferases [Parafrankia irregularis]